MATSIVENFIEQPQRALINGFVSRKEGSKHPLLMIESLQFGGFVVREWSRDPGDWCMELYATNNIDDALDWMKRHLNYRAAA